MASVATVTSIRNLDFLRYGTTEQDIQNVKDRMEGDVQKIEDIANAKEDLPDEEGESESTGPGAGIGAGTEGRQFAYTQESSLRIQLMHRMLDDTNLLDITKVFGQFEEIASDIKDDNIFMAPGSSNIDLGSDISKLRVSEFLKPDDVLARDLASDNAWLDVHHEGGTMGMGPLCIALDLSGSMCHRSAEMQADRSDIAVALTLCIQKIAKETQRHVLIMAFDNTIIYELDIEDGKIPPKDLLTLMTTAPRGGTNFRNPLRTARKWIEKHNYEGKADVVFITDGSAGDTWGEATEWHPQRPSDWDNKKPFSWADYYSLEDNQHECDPANTTCEICYGRIHNTDALDFWKDYHEFLHESKVRLWTLQLDDLYIDRPLAYISDHVFMGLDDPDRLKDAGTSLIKEMVEIRKPDWLS